MKSKGVAYLLWFFLGWAGIHRFYCGKWFTGLIWMFTFGRLGVGWFLDLFLTSGMVDMANLLAGGRAQPQQQASNQSQNIVVNITNPTGEAAPQIPAESRVEREVGSDPKRVQSMRQRLAEYIKD